MRYSSHLVRLVLWLTWSTVSWLRNGLNTNVYLRHFGSTRLLMSFVRSFRAFSIAAQFKNRPRVIFIQTETIRNECNDRKNGNTNTIKTATRIFIFPPKLIYRLFILKRMSNTEDENCVRRDTVLSK